MKASFTTLIILLSLLVHGQSCPDLVISKVEILSKSPETLHLRYTIKNIGYDLANVEGQTFSPQDNIRMGISLSTDKHLNSGKSLPLGSVILDRIQIPELNHDEIFESEVELSIPPSGRDFPFLHLHIDHTNILPECAESNNTYQTLVYPCSDLTVDFFHVEASESNGLEVLFEVKNVGEGSTQFWLETDTRSQPLDYALVYGSPNGEVKEFFFDSILLDSANQLRSGDSYHHEVLISYPHWWSDAQWIGLYLTPPSSHECNLKNNSKVSLLR